jgi:hypothetical protein
MVFLTFGERSIGGVCDIVQDWLAVHLDRRRADRFRFLLQRHGMLELFNSFIDGVGIRCRDFRRTGRSRAVLGVDR